MQIKEKNTMIQDIFPMHLSNEYHKKVPQADSFLMIFKDNYILAKMMVRCVI